ncbi:MAG: bifunctional DNA-formamidopyrimidine glycosylase/DNA-(apurinic or apyrimidinic site) lyase [Ferrovum sp.]|nr:bifunctional DNA-formamidopyrimidine glycosylase/DNA-(apurinic or apyrimidinic site) lyase [Ferrovum sp.]NDU87367.1 bifunctional DNA-formamidopyrimidine glycosylase/DNA-(apurinic or apyrimidinic site) lyase [Ferrovum sp.]
MPELPEVEVTRRALQPHVLGQTVTQCIVRQGQLRYPVAPELASLGGQSIVAVQRRGKYLILEFSSGALIVHLGMTGTLRYFTAMRPPQRHDHVDFLFSSGALLRYHDPRRFGALLWITRHEENMTTPFWEIHPCFTPLGVEPFDAMFDGDFLYRRTRGLQCAIKPLLLQGKLVVGAGNIYACESLFQAGIDPRRGAGRIGRERYGRLASAVRTVLGQAIEAGGSSLRDFVDASGNTGYFQLQHQVYGRTGQSCVRCGGPIRHMRQGQRSTWFCPDCQR